MNFSPDCYFNSGGIAFLIGITVESKKKGQTVSITGLSDHFKKIFKMVGLTRYVDIYDSVEDVHRIHL
jgi:anti-anti-sigma factor